MVTHTGGSEFEAKLIFRAHILGQQRLHRGTLSQKPKKLKY